MKILGVVLLGLLAFLAGYLLDAISLRSISFCVLGAAAASILFLPWHRAFQILFLYLGVEGFAKLLTNYHPIVHVGADLLVGALTARALLPYLFRKAILPAKLPPFTGLFAVHLAWFLISIANPYSINLMASVAGIKVYVTMQVLFFFGYYCSENLSQIRGYMGTWAVVALFQSVVSLYQASIGPSSVTRLGPSFVAALQKYEGYAFRPFGLTSQPGAPSVYLFLASPFIVYFCMTTRSFWIRVIAGLMLPLTAVTLVLCQVRSALFKAMLGSSFYLVGAVKTLGAKSPKFRRNAITAIVVGGVLLAVVVPRLLDRMIGDYEDNARAVERTLTLFDYNSAKRAREGNWERYIAYLNMVPLGAGLSRVGPAAGKFASAIDDGPFFRQGFFADNFWIAVQIDLGLPGVILMTALVFGIVGRGFLETIALSDPGLKAVGLALVASMVSSVFGFYGAEGVLYNPEAAFFWFFAGVLFKLRVLDDNLLQETSLADPD